MLEDINPDPLVTDSVSVLDTLYVASGGTVGGNPCGFYYRGTQNPTIIYLGFDMWTWGRASIIATFDHILQNVWGLPRQNLPRDPALASSPRRQGSSDPGGGETQEP